MKCMHNGCKNVADYMIVYPRRRKATVFCRRHVKHPYHHSLAYA